MMTTGRNQDSKYILTKISENSFVCFMESTIWFYELWGFQIHFVDVIDIEDKIEDEISNIGYVSQTQIAISPKATPKLFIMNIETFEI